MLHCGLDEDIRYFDQTWGIFLVEDADQVFKQWNIDMVAIDFLVLQANIILMQVLQWIVLNAFT